MKKLLVALTLGLFISVGAQNNQIAVYKLKELNRLEIKLISIIQHHIKNRLLVMK